MEKQKTQLAAIKLVGLTARTNNKNEMAPKTAKIGELAALYWEQQLAHNIKHRVQPGITYAAYTDFAQQQDGDYTYLIGEAVHSFAGQDLEKFKSLTVPAGSYQKFTTAPGKMPEVVISAWQEIWKMKASDFGGQRKWIADFEIYDQRAAPPNNAVIDIYIGIAD